MASNRRLRLGVGLGAIAAAALALLLWPREVEEGTGPKLPDDARAQPGPGSQDEAGGARRRASGGAKGGPADAGGAGGPGGVTVRGRIQAEWGSGPGQLGRALPQEGNPEAPMSLAADRFGSTVVLDQVNGRIVRYGPDGRPADFPVTQQAPQDLTVAADGTTLVLDRLADKTVAVLSPDGQLRGELPVEGKGIPEGGGVTGVFVDGDDVYLEREHGPLVRVGDTSGRPDAERPEIPGRPSRDGTFFVNAGVVDPSAGRLYVNAIDRPSLDHRFTRELRMGTPVMSIVLLDTDLQGIIYLGSLLEVPGPAGEPAPVIRVLCLAPADGTPQGSVEMPPSTGPEETFRELVVLDGGGVLFARHTESGVTVERYDCR